MSTANNAREDEMTLEKFWMCGKRQLKEYLRDRDLPLTGTKMELVALTYAARRMDCPTVPNNRKKLEICAAEYQRHSSLPEGSRLPDPLRKRLLCDNKEGKAFSYFPSKFLLEILFNAIISELEYCFCKTKCTLGIIHNSRWSTRCLTYFI